MAVRGVLPSVVYREPSCDDHLGEQIHPLLKKVLLHRGIGDVDELNYDLKKLPDPFGMKGMDRAVERLYQAVAQQQKIIIVGDFDADGATSTALMLLALKQMGFEQVSFVVPNRFEYGYGLSVKIVEEVSLQKPDLLITVDNGISSIEGVDSANALGIDVLVTDHHLPGNDLPKAYAILNPNQNDCNFVAKNSAGVGVAFYLLVALRKFLRERRWFEDQKISEPNLAEFFDLVALGTVADVVPLDAYNRLFVSQGIKRFRAGKMRPGLRALLQLAKKDFRFLVSTDLGFALGPRLNAAGRLDDMTQGILLLTTGSDELAFEFAQTLDEFNRDRRAIEQQMQQEALTIVEAMTDELSGEIPLGFCLYHSQWHQGVVGLVASRLKERFHRPVIAFAHADGADDNELKGSGRSIKGVHLRDLLDEVATVNPGLLDKFGGHAMAAGLSLQLDQLPEFERAFHQALSFIDDSVFEENTLVDGELEDEDFNLYTAQVLRNDVPWGQGLPAPVFVGKFSVINIKILQEKHIKFFLKPKLDGAVALDAIYFNADDEILTHSDFNEVTLVYRLDINFYRGEQKLQLMIEKIFL